jgi:hypothetical protein
MGTIYLGENYVKQKQIFSNFIKSGTKKRIDMPIL